MFGFRELPQCGKLSMATMIQGVQVALLPPHAADACFNQTFLQCTVT